MPVETTFCQLCPFSPFDPVLSCACIVLAKLCRYFRRIRPGGDRYLWWLASGQNGGQARRNCVFPALSHQVVMSESSNVLTEAALDFLLDAQIPLNAFGGCGGWCRAERMGGVVQR